MSNKKRKTTDYTDNIDRTNTICIKCKKGTYQETSIHDEIDGILHCVVCGHGRFRWAWVEET